MSRWRNNGGWNKSHGTIEKTPRVDSFEAGEIDGWGALFGYADGGIPLVLDCCHNTGCAPDGEWENLEVWDSKTGWSQTLELSRKRVRRQSDLFPLSVLWAAGAVSVSGGRGPPVPQMRPGEL